MAAESKTPWAKGPWTRDRYGALVDAHGAQVTLSDSGLSFACTNHSDQRLANSRLVSRAPELVEALEPFAALLQDHNSEGPDSQPIFGINDATITRGHLRKARALLQQIRGD